MTSRKRPLEIAPLAIRLLIDHLDLHHSKGIEAALYHDSEHQCRWVGIRL